VKIEFASGEQLPDFGWPDPFCLGIRRVEPEVVPQDHPLWTKHPKHFTDQVRLDAIIKYGCENSVLQDQVESIIGVWKRLTISAGKGYMG